MKVSEISSEPEARGSGPGSVARSGSTDLGHVRGAEANARTSTPPKKKREKGGKKGEFSDRHLPRGNKNGSAFGFFF